MTDNPLDRNDLQIINDALQALTDSDENIKRAKQAGFDMAEREERNATQKQQFLDIKRAFFPRSKA